MWALLVLRCPTYLWKNNIFCCPYRILHQTLDNVLPLSLNHILHKQEFIYLSENLFFPSNCCLVFLHTSLFFSMYDKWTLLSKLQILAQQQQLSKCLWLMLRLHFFPFTVYTSQNNFIFHVRTLLLFRIPTVSPDSHLCSPENISSTATIIGAFNHQGLPGMGMRPLTLLWRGCKVTATKLNLPALRSWYHFHLNRCSKAPVEHLQKKALLSFS